MYKILAATLAIATALSLPALAQEKERQPVPQTRMSSEADSFIGKKAMNAQGKDVGDIEDVLVDQSGKVQAMILDHDGKKRAVPWDQVSMQGDQVTINLSEQQLSELPEYRGEKE